MDRTAPHYSDNIYHLHIVVILYNIIFIIIYRIMNLNQPFSRITRPFPTYSFPVTLFHPFQKPSLVPPLNEEAVMNGQANDTVIGEIQHDPLGNARIGELKLKPGARIEIAINRCMVPR